MSDGLNKIKISMGEIEIVDIPTMYGMSDEQYRDFIQAGGLMWIDHHEILRSYVAEYPIATTREQLDILIEELQRLRSKMIPRDVPLVDVIEAPEESN
jgi:hypothetical protein